MFEDSPHLQEILANAEIIYTDLDGTLLAKGGTLLKNQQGQPSLTTAEAVVRANKAGFPIVPVSGRSRLQMTEIVRMVGWNDFIAEAGSIRTYWNGVDREIIYDIPEWRFDLEGRTPLDWIRESGALEALQEAFPGCIEYHEPWHENREATEVLRGFLSRQEALEVLDKIPLALSLIDNGVINPTKTTLKKSDEPVRAYHLTPAGITKRRAIALDLERRDIDPARAVMLGDAPSDMMVAEVLGASILMKNTLRSPGIVKRVEALPNAAFIGAEAGEGWAQAVHFILDNKN